MRTPRGGDGRWGRRDVLALAGSTVLARWLGGWRFAPEPGREVRLSGMVTLRPKGGLPLRLAART